MSVKLATGRMIHVLVVEDSAVVREVIRDILETDPEIKVAGFAADGEQAVIEAARLRPDLITMDVRMPKMDGLEATRLIMQSAPTPIVIVSARVDDQEQKVTFNAIKAGALAVVEKPSSLSHRDFEGIRESLITTIKLMADVKVVTRWPRRPAELKKLRLPARNQQAEVLAIGASTGGPMALSVILHQLPDDFAIPIVVAQHIARGFGSGFAEWLRGETGLDVKIAQSGDELRARLILLSPDDCHMGVTADGKVRLVRKTSYNHYCPSINHLFETVAKAYGGKAVGVILTGMGEDGAMGMRLIKEAGGRTIAQDEKSSVVFGMPKAAIAHGAVDRVASLDQMVATILSLV